MDFGKHCSHYSDTSVRLRQRATLQTNNPIIRQLVPIFYDELFFNLNNVQWVDTETVNQNRAFLGFDIEFKSFTLQIGYINQLQFKISQTEMSHILWTALKF